jgi:hypothetical protein
MQNWKHFSIGRVDMIECGDGELQKRIDAGECPRCRAAVSYTADYSECGVCGLVMYTNNAKALHGGDITKQELTRWLQTCPSLQWVIVSEVDGKSVVEFNTCLPDERQLELPFDK